MAGWDAPSLLAASDQFGYEDQNQLANSVIAAVFDAGMFLGGSRDTAVAGTGYQDAANYLDFRVPDAASTGATYKVYVDLLCENAATSITPKIRNITDSSDTVVGSASTSTSWAEQTLTFVPVAGKKYRLMFVKGNDTNRAFGIGFIQRTAT